MQDGNQNEPGWVFKPGDEPNTQPAAPAELPPTPEVEPVTPKPVEVETPPAPATPEAVQQQPAQPAPSEMPTEEESQQAPTENAAHVEWTASEYIAHQKNAGWFALLALATLGVAAVVFLVTSGDLIATVVIGLLGVSLGIFAARQPKVLNYAIDSSGIHIGQKFYPYGSFKSFSVVHDQAMGYISLAPLRRFMPPLSVHYDPNDENKIAQTLAEYLPYDDHKPDMTDTITRKIRF